MTSRRLLRNCGRCLAVLLQSANLAFSLGLEKVAWMFQLQPFVAYLHSSQLLYQPSGQSSLHEHVLPNLETERMPHSVL